MTRQKLVLAALLGLLGLSLTYAFWTAPRQKRVVPVTSPRSTVERAGRTEKTSPVDEKRRVWLDLLIRGEDAFSEPARNIFRLTEVQPQPSVPVPPEPPPPPVAVQPVPVVSAEPVARPAPHFTWLGFLRKAGQKTVFLSANNEIYLVREGHRFGPGQEFQIAEIKDKKLIIHQASGGSPITVSLADESSPSSFASRSSLKPLSNTRRPTPFVPPRIPTRRNEQEEATFEEPQIIDEPEEVNSSPPVEDFPEPDVPQDDATGMSSLPLRSMLQ